MSLSKSSHINVLLRLWEQLSTLRSPPNLRVNFIYVRPKPLTMEWAKGTAMEGWTGLFRFGFLFSFSMIQLKPLTKWQNRGRSIRLCVSWSRGSWGFGWRWAGLQKLLILFYLCQLWHTPAPIHMFKFLHLRGKKVSCRKFFTTSKLEWRISSRVFGRQNI